MSRSSEINQQRINTLIDLLRYRSEHQADQKAYTYLENGETDTSIITFAALDQRAQSIAAHLQQHLQQGDRVLLLYPSGLDFITAFFGCLYAGIVAIPVNLPRPNRPLTRLNAIVTDAQVTHVLTTAAIQPTIHSACMNMPMMRKLDWICTDNVTGSGNWQQPQLTGDTLAYLQYTSGSTATPKGVMVSHANLLQNMAILDHGWNHTPESTLISWLPLFHDMGLIYGMLQSLYNGIPCVLLSPVHFLQKPVRWLQAITRFRGTHSAAPNFAYDLCVDKISPEQRQTLDLRSWRVALNGAEPVRKTTLERFTEIFAPYGLQDQTLCPGYGLAEGTLKVAATPEHESFMFCTIEAVALEQNKIVETSGDHTHTLVSSGRTALDTDVVIVHPQHQTRCAGDEVGEIWVSGSSVAQGYWQRPSETAETFQAYLQDTGEGPFLRTGDLGFLHNEHVFVTGRLKDVIIIRGRNHYPQDIEHTIEESHTAIRSGCSAAFSIDNAGTEELVVICEIEREHRRTNLADVVETILQVVSEQHDLSVHAIVLIRPGSIPKTSSGKIQRRACRTLFSEGGFQVLHSWTQTAIQDTPETLIDNRPLLSATQPPDRATIQKWLVERFAAHLHKQPTAIDPHASIDQLRLNSLTAINIIGELGDWLGRDLSPTLFYNYQTIAALAHHLTQDGAHQIAQTQVSEKQPHNEPIAIVGVGCRFPGAESIEAFWDLLIQGTNAIREVPAQRWDADHFYNPTPATKGKMNTRWGGFLDHIDTFDAPFFGISPREAACMDPQQRLLLEVAWEALEHGGLAPEQLAGTSTGVFVGISTNEYQRLQFSHPDSIDAYAGTGTALSIAANRLSYLLNLNGPSMAIDTACSSSLVAVHLACQSLQRGECDTAIAGGSNVILRPETSIALAQAQMLSPSGQCKTFDTNADGYVRGEGCGVIVLKRLSDAHAAKDCVLAVIRGSAINQDGRSNGLSAPNGMAQRAVIQQALNTAQVAPTDISYVETHGTGTSLGDPIEVEALVHILQEQRDSNQPCVLGSVKTNIGHLEASAGIAGLIKTALALWHNIIPPHLHLENLNPYIQLDRKPFLINTQPQEWPRNGQPRYAGISSFGFGGTNAHVIVQDAPTAEDKTVAPQKTKQRSSHVLTLSAKSETALTLLADSYAQHIATHSNDSLEDICYTSNVGRSHLSHRFATVASTPEQLREQLQSFASGKSSQHVQVQQTPSAPPAIIWLFSGQGSQYRQMGKTLYETQPIFRMTLDRCADILASYLDTPLLDLLYLDTASETLIHETAYTQPVLFAFEYALAEMWRSWGIVPAAVMGHSVGEYVAACVAGVFSLEDGLRLIAERGRLMQSLPKDGQMAVVFADEAFVRSAIEPYSANLAIAAINGPTNITISGERHAIEAMVQRFEAEGITTRPLSTSHAFHSPLMDPITDTFEAFAKQLQFDTPHIPLVSNLTGTFLETGYIPDAAYWRRHIREAVRFADGVQTLQTLEQPLFIELGPTSSLISMGKRCADGAGTWLSTLKQKQDDWNILLQTLGKLYVNGISIDWEKVAEGYPHYQRISLPTYPFERTSYWFKTPEYQNNGKTQSVEVYTKGDTISMEEVVQKSLSTSNDTIAPVSRLDTIRATVRSMLTRLLEMAPEDLDAHTSFLDIGADSIVLIHAIQSIQSTFGIDISVRQMFEGLNTLEAVAIYLDQQLPADAYVGETTGTPINVAVETTASVIPSDHTPELDSVTPIPVLSEHFNGQSSELERIMTQQLASISSIITKQLEVLHTQSTIAQKDTTSNGHTLTNGVHKGNHGTNDSHKNGVQHINPAHNGKTEEHTLSVKSEPEAFVPYKAIDPGTTSELTPQQQTYLDTFIERYTARTASSKQQAQHDQRYHADLRNTMHFHLTTKELCYPLVAPHALGSKMWDIDGNEYVDLTMGFGVNFFGHQEPFIQEALQAQLQQGIQVGPQSQLAGEVAKLMCELTGAERVTFCNSGSEAVMTALRLARAATGRHKIAIFAGSYHGTFDGILATSKLVDGQTHTIPMAPGVTPHMVEDTLVIPFDSPRALKVLREHQHELAAVLVEPVQSRRPDLQPKAFLQEVRTLTQEAGIALIFDEVITGFRVHPGGAQAWYGIQADLATYGKVMGGGMPIGAVAGKAAFMNTVDGGEWSFQDQSYPRARTTFYSGTFCKHPLAMAAGRAVLQRIKESGPRLQEELNERVAQLAQTLNAYFEDEQVPISVIHFGSLFRFAFAPQLTFSQVVNLWFYHLIEKGIYIWEGRNCIVSTAHTDSDYARIIDAVKQSVVELRAGGFLPHAADDPGPNRGSGSSSKTTENTTIPLTEAQHQLVMLTQMGGSALELVALRFRGSFDVDVLQKVIQQATNRHEALRIVIDQDNEHQHILPYQKVDIPIIDMSHMTDVEQDHQIDEWLVAESQHQFNLTQGPLVRWHVLKRSVEDHMLVLTANHIVLDGWSIVVLLREIGKHYQAMCKGQTVHFDPTMQWQEFIQQHTDYMQSDQAQASQAYWLNFFNDTMPLFDLPTDRPRPKLKTYSGGSQSLCLGKVRRNHIRQLSQTFGCTPFMTLIATYMLQLHQLSGQDDLIVGFPVSGRPLKGSEALLGYCSHLVVVRSQIQEDMDFATYLSTVCRNLLTTYEHQDYPFASLVNKLNLPHDPSRSPLVNITFNLERPIDVADTFGMDVDFVPPPRSYITFDVEFNINDVNDDFIINFDYNIDLFDAATIQRMLAQYQTLIDQIIDAPHARLNTYTLGPSDNQITPTDSHVMSPEPRLEPSSKQTVLDNPTIEDAYALTASQMRILFQDIATNAKNNHIEQTIIDIDESLNQEAFTQAWHQVIARQAVLRTGFAWNDLDTPMQIVYRHANIPINYINLRHLSPSLQEQRLAQHMETLRQDSGFDIAQPPLMDATVFQLGQAQYRCVWTNHQILLDGWAKSLILHEVYACYKAFAAHERPELGPAPRYQHYIDWIQRQDMTAAERYWRALLSDFTTPNLIGTHHNKEYSTNDDIIYHHKTQTLSQQETTALLDWAHANQVTLNALVQGAWSLLLHRYTGDADVVFGNVVSVRNAQVSGIESMVGLLTNTLPVRTYLQPGISALEWVRRLQIQQDETAQYAYSPLMKVQDWSNLPSGDVLFESVLVFENHPVVHDDAWTVHNCSPQHTGYPLHVMVEPGTELQIRLTGRGDRFDVASIERLQGHLTHLLTQLVTQPNNPVTYLSLLTPTEQHQLLVDWNATTTLFPIQHTFPTHFLAQAQRTPTAIAVTDATTSLSYADLVHQATHLATHLIQHGLQPEGVVALLADRDTAFLVALLGILLAGGTYMPLDPQNPPARWHQILGQSHAQFVLTTESYAATLQTEQGLTDTTCPTILDLPTLGAIAQPAPVDLPTLTPNLRAYILFTSGSTGQPKGAMLTHQGMLNHLFAKIQDLDLQPTDVVAQTALQCFDISVWQFLAALLVGARVHILPDTIAHAPDALLNAIPTHHITILETVPALLRTLLETTTTPPPGVGALRWLIPTGEALPPDVAQTWLVRYPQVPLMNAYGPTECSDDVTHAVITTPKEVPDNTVPIGTPIANTQLYVLDSADMPLPIHVPGELWVGGTGVGRGYLYDPTRTAAIFRPDPFSAIPGARRYRTGDRARYRPDGQLEFLGRIDHQVKVRGFRIELGEIEAILQQHPAVHAVVVTVWQGKTDKDGRLVAYLVGVDGQSLPTVSIWRAYVGEHLPEYMIPAAYVELEELPLTRNGKVDRRALPEPEFDQTAEEYTGPRNETESLLTHIWAEVLGLPRVGIHDNFFELGGNSLLATRFIARMPDYFRIDVPLRQIFLSPTIAGFAEAIEIDVTPEDATEIASQDLQTFGRGEKSLEDLLEEFQHLSEEEVLTLLAEMDEAETKS